MGEFVILYFFFEAALQRLFVVVACVCFFIYIFKYIIKHCGSCVYLFSLNTSVFSKYLLCPYVSITRYLLFVLTTFFLLLFSSCFDTILFFLIEKSQKKKHSVQSAWPTPHTQMSLRWNQKHNLLFSGSVAGTVHAWDVEARDEVTCLIGHDDMVLDLCSLDTIESIASCSLDTTISIWDVLTGSRRQLLQGHRMGVTSMAYHEERRLLFSSGFDHDALVWSPFTPTVLYKLKGHTCPLVGVEVSFFE